MAFDAGQVPLFGPAAVAVHDDRHMSRQSGFGFETEMGG
jgi:hypothetical protein